MSLLEAGTNVVVGFALALAAQMLIFPIFGLAVSTRDNLLISVMFTGISLARSFALRRLFERIRTRSCRPDL
jgi:hypothetical protein